MGEAITGVEAVSVAQAARPDLVVMDLHMPGLDGVEATRQVLAASPETAVLILTMHDDEGMLMAALRAGARGYLLKERAPTRSPRRCARSSAAGRHSARGWPTGLLRLTGPAQTPTAFPQLTRREVEVLELLAGGMGNQEMARRLWLSPKMVRNHVANIVAKLEVNDRYQAIVMARDAGLGRDAPA